MWVFSLFRSKILELEIFSKMIVHHLKILPEYYAAIVSNEKRFELRKNDRSFQVGDFLLLLEFDIATQRPTERWIKAEVVYHLEGERVSDYGLKKGYCCMSLNVIAHGNSYSELSDGFSPQFSKGG
ncbi:MAG: DUF3850 domain-containing protein [Deltaproteobacteria bacterium]|jgi:hypothetical protein|nr:DUF3850 domain-containing protein [Deltaproteobacteria bacterium]